jgi:hypothetical protein
MVAANVKEGVQGGLALLFKRISSYLHLKKEVELVSEAAWPPSFSSFYVVDFFGCLRFFFVLFIVISSSFWP